MLSTSREARLTATGSFALTGLGRDRLLRPRAATSDAPRSSGSFMKRTTFKLRVGAALVGASLAMAVLASCTQTPEPPVPPSPPAVAQVAPPAAPIAPPATAPDRTAAQQAAAALPRPAPLIAGAH